MRSGFVVLALTCVTAVMANPAGAVQRAPRSPLPRTLVEGGIEATLFAVARTKRWEIFYADQPFFDAPPATDLVVVSFRRKASDGIDLPPVMIELYDEDDVRLKAVAYVIYDGDKIERAFLVPEAARLRNLLIDALSFDLSELGPQR